MKMETSKKHNFLLYLNENTFIKIKIILLKVLTYVHIIKY